MSTCNRFRRLFLVAVLAVLSTACATTAPSPQPTRETKTESPVPIVATPDLETAPVANPEPVAEIPAPMPTPPIVTPAPAPQIEEKPVVEYHPAFDALPYWAQSNVEPALKSFRQSCKVWARRKDNDWLNANLPAYGRFGDWRTACEAVEHTPSGKIAALNFFQSHFKPAQFVTGNKARGQLTGYYAPQIDVRRQANPEFSEPILARPKSLSLQKQPRSNITASTSKVLAYGRPMEVFFLQIQGSGRIKFDDGTIYRAAFDGHNSHKYVSIGKVLVGRGELTLAQASKQSIESWMTKAGPDRARALMNENPRYIYFKTENLNGESGPKGSMGAPLTAMGSMAVDPRYHPYGALVWLQAKLPQYGGDYNGAKTGLLVSVQDSGGAIKGAQRGDLFFGAGDEAGERAGVMKHEAIWTVLLPNSLVSKSYPTS